MYSSISKHNTLSWKCCNSCTPLDSFGKKILCCYLQNIELTSQNSVIIWISFTWLTTRNFLVKIWPYYKYLKKIIYLVSKGDSGNPVFQIVNGKAYLYGINSSGNAECKLYITNHIIVTNVNYFRLWIAENTKWKFTIISETLWYISNLIHMIEI